MITDQRLYPLLLFALMIGLLSVSPPALAEDGNAEVVSGNAQLRAFPPRFDFTTLFRFRLVPGPVLKIIPKGSRVQVTNRRTVSRTQIWYQVEYRSSTGWVYGGEVRGRRFLKLDSGVRIPTVPQGAPLRHGWLLNGSWPPSLAAPARAQTEIAPDIPVIEAPPADTDPFRTLLIGSLHVVIFIASLFAIRRWIFPNSHTYSFLASLCVLLILGVISETAFQNVLTRFAS